MPILPLVPPLLLYLLWRRSTDAMSAFIRAAVAWGVLLLIGTELLSLDRMLTPAGLAIGWSLVTLLLAGPLWSRRRIAAVSAAPAPGLPWWALLPALSILLITLVIALVAPPNSTDALTYHLGRVALWMQHRGVQAYATSVTRQIFMPPWAEYLVLHFQILAGGSDRFASLVEWLAFTGCLVVGAGIARRLGASATGVGLTIVLMATLPTAVIEASSTQTDLVVAFWAAVLVWLALEEPGRSSARSALLAGGALGLAIASKGTAYVICAPFTAWLLLRRGRAAGVRTAAIHGGGLAASALLVAAPQYARNLQVFHNPLGPLEARADLGNLAHGAGALGSNVVRNATIHLRTPVPGWNDQLARAVVHLHRLAGLDPEDPNTTYPGERFAVPLISTYEGRMGNPLHFLVFGAVAVIALLRPPEAGRRGYGVAVLAGALLFCWVFRWQHWHGRLHTPFFLLAAPLVGTLLEPLATRWRAPAAIALVFWGGSLPWLLANQMRPLLPLAETRFTYAAPSIFAVPRERQYFGQDVAAVYLRVLDDLARTACADLGVIGGEETRLYPLFPFARTLHRQARVYYLSVQNRTRLFEEPHPRPCALFVAEVQRPGWRPPDETFEPQWSEGPFALYLVPGAR